MASATRWNVVARMVLRAVAGLVLAASAARLIGCGESTATDATAPPRTTGVTGATSNPAGEHRIVALSPAMAVTLRDLGFGDRIVGRHGYDLALDPAIPVCGDQAGIDYESLIRVRPTHVIVQWGARDLPPRLNELARSHGWIVLNYDLLTLHDVRTSAVELHDVLAGPESEHAGHQATTPTARAAAEPPPLLARLESAFRRRGTGFPGAGRVLLLVSASPIAVVGPGSFHHQVLESIGGIPAVTRGGPYQELDVEDVMRLAPDAVVLIRPRGREASSATGTVAPDRQGPLLGTLSGRPIPAVTAGRIALIDDPLCLLPGSSLADFADDLAAILVQWNASPGP